MPDKYGNYILESLHATSQTNRPSASLPCFAAFPADLSRRKQPQLRVLPVVSAFPHTSIWRPQEHLTFHFHWRLLLPRFASPTTVKRPNTWPLRSFLRRHLAPPQVLI